MRNIAGYNSMSHLIMCRVIAEQEYELRERIKLWLADENDYGFKLIYDETD